MRDAAYMTVRQLRNELATLRAELATAERRGAERALRLASPFSEHEEGEEAWMEQMLAALFPATTKEGKA